MSRLLSSLRAHLLLLVLLPFIPAVALMLHTALDRRDDEIQRVRAEVERLTGTSALTSALLVMSTRQMLASFALNPAVQERDPATCEVVAAQLLRQYPLFTSLTVFAPNGESFCSTAHLDPPVSVADLRWFRRAVETRDFAVGEYEIDRVTGKSVRTFAWPLLDGTGEVQAVLGAPLDLTLLALFTQQGTLPPGTNLTAINSEGTIIFRYPDLEQWGGKPLPEAPLWTAILSRQHGVMASVGADGVARLFAFQPMAIAGDDHDYLIMGIPTAPLLGGIEHNLRRDLAVLGLAALLTLVVAWAAIELALLRRMGRVLTAIQRMAGGDLSARTGLRRRQGEIGRLARGFDDMAAALEQRVAERRQAEEALRAGERRFRSLVQNASDVIAILDARGGLHYISPSVIRLLGYRPDEMMEADPMQFVHPEDTGRIQEAFAREVHQPGQQSPVEFRVQHRDGSWRTVEAIAINLLHDPSVGGMVVTYRDITERKQFEAQLAHQAFHDALTGLPNRALFLDRLEHALGRAGRNGGTVAVLFLDLDRFKVINDSLGHAAGDELLVAAAQRLASFVRPGDTVARLGGDEFVALLEDLADPSDATGVAERIIETLRQPFTAGGQEVFVSASIGVVCSSPGPARPTPEKMILDADVALYRAKAAGKARFVVFDPSMNARAAERLSLETDLRRALERGELQVYYQPEVQLASGAVVGMEALVRWQHPVRGLILPAEFIPLAEETGLILPIGEWVLAEACRQATAWQALRAAGPPLIMSVNLSARQFEQPDLPARIARALEVSGLNPARLRLEITESTVMRDIRSAVGAIHALKALGVRLAIDDFGTGYSSLSYLQRFAVNTLKIDRAFVSTLHSDESTAAIVQAIAALACALGMDVTAEGIETDEQLVRVCAAGCDRGQGYYFAEPMPAPQAEAMLTTTLFSPALVRAKAAAARSRGRSAR